MSFLRTIIVQQSRDEISKDFHEEFALLVQFCAKIITLRL